MIGTKRPDLTAEKRRGLAGSFIKLSEGVTHYELQGHTGDPRVVLIHGNAAPYITWDNTIGDLCDAGLNVLRYDLYGHGFSDRPRLRTYNRVLYNEQLTELLSRLEIPYPINVVGSSQGGSIGACFAARNPGRVEKLALLAPFFDDFPGRHGLLPLLLKNRPLGELLMKAAKDEKLADLSDAIETGTIRATLEAQVVEQYEFAGKRRAILANWRGDALQDATSCYEAVKQQGIPTFLTWGSLDKKLSGDSIGRLRDLLPEIEYHELEGAGHLAHYESPDLINPPLIRFLSA